jgi:hypothetical protein
MTGGGSPRQPLSSSTRDPLLSALLAVIAALALGGWVFALAKPDIRAFMMAQPLNWWLPQAIILAQAVLCVTLLIGWNVRGPLLILTALVLLIGLLMWTQGMSNTGRHPFPFTPVLNALLLWRLWKSKGEAAAQVAA